ncbi:MAG: gamma carbonic anhydrase family protein [Methylotenera sp.]|nr:gamma carbonic anhydrase family protein [Oligoflexia bacterium]
MILPWRGKWPEIHETAFIAPSADIIGDVKIGTSSSVWFQCVIRGDVHSITIGSRTNVQDHSMLHVTRRKSKLVIGDDVTIGHRVTLHGCTIGNRILLGMGAIVLDDAVVGDDCIVGAGTLITKGTVVPPGSLIVGSPGKVVRKLKPEEIAFLLESSANYVGDSKEYQTLVRGPQRLGADDSDLEDDSGELLGDLSDDSEDDLNADLDLEQGSSK